MSELLANPQATRATSPQVLSVYSQVRLPIAYEILDRSRRNGWLCHFYDPKNPDIGSDAFGLERIRSGMQKNQEWQIEIPGLEDELKSAKDLLEKALK